MSLTLSLTSLVYYIITYILLTSEMCKVGESLRQPEMRANDLEGVRPRHALSLGVSAGSLFEAQTLNVICSECWGIIRGFSNYLPNTR